MAYYDPTFDVNFAAGDSPVTKYGFTFTRATAATYVNAAGNIATAASGELRYTYDPVTLSALGVLIEEQRQNLWLNSEAAASWGGTRTGTPSSNSTTAPDGASSADTIIEDASASNTHYHFQSTLACTSGTAYTMSAFVKAKERTQCTIVFQSDNAVFASATTIFNLSTKTVISGTGTITDFGNGWLRVSATATAAATANGKAGLGLASGGSATYSGDGTSGLYAWGLQFEAGAFPTSYIPTTGTAATRNADVLSLTGAAGRTNLVTGSAAPSTQTITVANSTQYTLSQTGSGTITLSGASTSGPLVGAGSLTFTTGSTSLTLTMSGSPANVQLETGAAATTYIPTTNGPRTVENVASWFNGDAGTIVCTTAVPPGNTFPQVIRLGESTGNNRIDNYWMGTTNIGYEVRSSAVSQAAGLSAKSASATQIISFAYAENNSHFAVNGALGGSTDTSCVMPYAIANVTIGSTGSSQWFNAPISRIRYYNSRIPNADLIRLSNGEDLSTPVARNVGAGKSRKTPRRRRVVIDDRVYDVPERDVAALLEAAMLGRRPPKTAEVVDSEVGETETHERTEPADDTPSMPWHLPEPVATLESAQQRYQQMLAQINAQAAADVARILDRVAARVMAELQDEEDAVTVLLLH